MRLSLSVLSLLCASVFPLAAHATTFDFSIAGNGEQYRFSIDPVNTPSDSTSIPGIIFFTVSPDVTDVNSFGTYDFGSFVALGAVPGNEFLSIGEISFSTPDIFDGTTFAPGTYSTSMRNDPNTTYDLTITTASAVPEPSSLALMGTGIVGAFGVARRRLVR